MKIHQSIQKLLGGKRQYDYLITFLSFLNESRLKNKKKYAGMRSGNINAYIIIS
jgi:hypothetical protein